MIIFVDIDNTICLTTNSDYINSIPIIDKIDIINNLYYKGHKIVYWTARGSKSGIDHSDLTKSQLLNWGCLFHELKMGKPSYDVLIDDKSINDVKKISDIIK